MSKELFLAMLILVFAVLVLRGWAIWYTPPILFSSLTETTVFWANLEPSGTLCADKLIDEGTVFSLECERYFARLRFVHNRLPTEETLNKWWATATTEQKSEYNYRKGLANIVINEIDKELKND